MRLSEAIRLGAMLKPQAFGLFMARSEPTLYGDVLSLRRADIGTCALGAALEAAGVFDWDDENKHSTILRLFPVAAVWLGRPCSACQANGQHVMHEIACLNNARMAREQIADWVEQLETSLESALADPAVSRLCRGVEPTRGATGRPRPQVGKSVCMGG